MDSPFQGVGRQDLTAHVDMTAVEAAATRAGLDKVGVTTQAELLASLGAGELLAGMPDRPGATVEDYLTARSALVRMLDPAAMGRFRVLLFGRGLPLDARLKGLEFRLPAR
jgi:SAM-dependent MidA family methyltransferase